MITDLQANYQEQKGWLINPTYNNNKSIKQENNSESKKGDSLLKMRTEKPASFVSCGLSFYPSNYLGPQASVPNNFPTQPPERLSKKEITKKPNQFSRMRVLFQKKKRRETDDTTFTMVALNIECTACLKFLLKSQSLSVQKKNHVFCNGKIFLLYTKVMYRFFILMKNKGNS